MSAIGSNETGEEIIAGGRNRANHPTMVLGTSRWADGAWWPFDGGMILLVTPPGPFPHSDSDNERYIYRPLTRTDGVVAIGCMGGAGVRGVGNQPEGRRGETAGSGTGGHGVVGHGGTGDLELSTTSQYKDRATPFNPGIGVLGLGGHWTMPKVSDPRGGAGVVGVGGGGQAPAREPTFDEVRGVGVYAISYTAEGIVAQGAPTAAGIRTTGKVGLEAHGVGDGFAASGVGVIGDGAPDGVGVRGNGAIGVEALGRRGRLGPTSTGLFAKGELGGDFEGYHTAARFATTFNERQVPRAQVHLVPSPMFVPAAAQGSQYDVFPPAQVDQLPRRAQAGEMMVTIQTVSPERRSQSPPDAEASLWLCVRSGGDYADSEPPAVWKQVLLGPSIAGTQITDKG